jgi:hypothetical protein
VLIPTIENVKIKYILAILNSSVCSYFITKKFKSIKLLRSHIESMPIPYASKEKQNEISALVDEIMMSDEKAPLYSNLDSIITELYGLTFEEASEIYKSLEGKNKFLL